MSTLTQPVALAEEPENPSPTTAVPSGGLPGTEGFQDRRRASSSGFVAGERRQFGNSYRELSEEALELAVAIDQYKVHNRRRYITFEEMYNVIQGLGYHK